MPLYEVQGKRPTIAEDAWIAPSAELIGDVRIGPGVSIWFGVTIRADNTPIILGAGSNIQENCVLHSDPPAPLTIGKGVTVGHLVILHGCTIGDHAMIGMGSTVMNHSMIGEESIVGAGSLIPERKSFEPRNMILGAPARIVRPLRPEEIAGLPESAAVYNHRARTFAAELRRCD